MRMGRGKISPQVIRGFMKNTDMNFSKRKRMSRVRTPGYTAKKAFTKMAAKAQALFIRKYGRDTFLHAHDRLNEAYDFKKAQELLETDVETGLKIRYEEVQNSELDDLWNGMCWGADPVHLHDHDPAVQKSGLVDPRLPQGHSGEVF